ncbi:hypothetical protein Ancab_036229 [Ancistrocladus abbreviatus]
MAQETPIRFGILGCASIARKLSRAIKLAPNATIHAIGSRSINKAQDFAESNGYSPSTKIYGSYEEVLDDPDVDAVYIPLPTVLHLRYAVLAAEKKKHVLLEKPVAPSVAELDKILEACEANGVQFMDSTMWLHHPRTAKMKDFLSDPQRFGQPHIIQSCLSFSASPDFLQNDIRMNPDLDGQLGALGDMGWYCIGASLWATDYQLPKTVTAIQGALTNEAGVLLTCGASLVWEDGKAATFHCSYLSNASMAITVIGTRGTLLVNDFGLPWQENIASFTTATETTYVGLLTGMTPLPSEHKVTADLPQEALMVKEFSALAWSIKKNGSKPEKLWPTFSRKTQLVLDAIKASFSKSCQPVEVLSTI